MEILFNHVSSLAASRPRLYFEPRPPYPVPLSVPLIYPTLFEFALLFRLFVRVPSTPSSISSSCYTLIITMLEKVKVVEVL